MGNKKRSNTFAKNINLFLAKVQMRKYGQPYQYEKVENVVNCANCGTPRVINTICMKCYEDIRIETNSLKRHMMDYNPYLGQRQRPLTFKKDFQEKESS